jgi:hypothetical protein
VNASQAQENPNTYVEMAASTLKGELMAITLDELKAARDVWQKLSEDDQDGVIERVEKRCRDAVTQTIRLLSSHGFARVPAALEQLTVKDGIKAVAVVAKTDPARHELIDAQGSIVTLVIADLSQFTDAPHGHKAEPNQTDIPFVDGEIVDVEYTALPPPSNDGEGEQE